MINVFIDRNCRFLFHYSELDYSFGDALWICHTRDGEKQLFDFFPQLLGEINVYAYFFDDDKYTCKISEKMKDFKGAFGKKGLSTFQKNIILKRKIQTERGKYYCDVARVNGLHNHDWLKFLDLLFMGESGFILASKKAINAEEQNKIFDYFYTEILSTRFDENYFLISKISKKALKDGYYQIFLGEDMDSTRTVIILGNDLLNLVGHLPQEIIFVHDSEIEDFKKLLQAKGHRIILPNTLIK